jgi:hypothetical protein
MIKIFKNIRQSLIMENKTSKYFKYAIGEIVLVVIGILIALQINNWNETRKSSIQEKIYLERLVKENLQNLESFKNEIYNITLGVESIEVLSAALKNNSISDSLLIAAAHNFFKYGSIYHNFTSSTSTFDDLSSTGNLTLISNSSLRDRIVKHYAKHNEVAERVQSGIDWALPIDAPLYLDDVMKYEPSTSFLFPEESQAELANDLKINTLKIISNISAHYWINKDTIQSLEALIEDTRVLINALQQEIKST